MGAAVKIGAQPVGASRTVLGELLAYLDARRYKSFEIGLGDHQLASTAATGGRPTFECFLRARAMNGDCFAMLRLGDCLLESRETDGSHEEGFQWIERAAAAGSGAGLERFAGLLLDSPAPWRDAARGEAILRQSAECGQLTAMCSLGHRLVEGDGVRQDCPSGESLIRNAAKLGERLSMIILSLRLESEGRPVEDLEEGAYWRRRAGANSAQMLPNLGSYVYARSLSAFTPRERRRIANVAAILFLRGYEQSDIGSALNLAYLIRRHEVPKDRFPSFEKLVQGPLDSKVPSAIVNYALHLVGGRPAEDDAWRAADKLCSTLSSSSGIMEWWGGRASEGLAEGHIVIAWMVRWRLAMDPDALSLTGRLNLARNAGEDVPQWMDESPHVKLPAPR